MLAPDKEHKKTFPKVPILGFRNGKSLKDYLVKGALPKMDNTEGSEACGNGTCQVCNQVISTKILLITINTFTTKAYGEVFKIQSGNSENVIYLLRPKFVMIHLMLEKLKQSFVFGLIIIKVNFDLFEKENKCTTEALLLSLCSKLPQRY